MTNMLSLLYVIRRLTADRYR